MSERTGTVWIAEDLDPQESLVYTGRFSGYLDRDDRCVETFGDLAIDEAIAWGRSRAEVVLLRIGGTDYFSAGERNPDPEELPQWPPAEPLRIERRRVPGFEALDNTEGDAPVLWDVRVTADDVDVGAYHDAVRRHPATQDVQAPARGYAPASAAFLVLASTEADARRIGEEIAAQARDAAQRSSRSEGGWAIYGGAEVYPHRPGVPVDGPGVGF